MSMAKGVMATIAASIGINIAKWGIPADTGDELDFDGDTTGTSCALCVFAENGEKFSSVYHAMAHFLSLNL